MLEVEGDLVEAGVFRGGATGAMFHIMNYFDLCNRTLWACDSWEGQPEPVAQDRAGRLAVGKLGLHKATLNQTAGFLEMMSANSSSVVMVKGWFNQTLPSLPAR